MIYICDLSGKELGGGGVVWRLTHVDEHTSTFSLTRKPTVSLFFFFNATFFLMSLNKSMARFQEDKCPNKDSYEI